MQAAPRRRSSGMHGRRNQTLDYAGSWKPVDRQDEIMSKGVKHRSNHANQDSKDPCPGIHVVAKPIGPACNLNCEYCFYLEKKALFGPREDYRMPDDVLAAFIRGYIEAQPTPAVEFVWQGGEPTLLGMDFFKRVVRLQKSLAGQKTITNSLQTNGTLLTDKWCAFLKKHGFLVGIQFPYGMNVKFKYYLSEFHKQDFVDGSGNKPYEGLHSQVFYFSLSYLMFKNLDFYEY